MNIRKFFQFEERGVKKIRTEILAGCTTFMTMAYILIVNSSMLAETGMDGARVFSATAIAAAVSTLVMGLYANLPLAMAPGMGLNAFFAYTVCIGMGHSWRFALAAVFLEGLIFLVLTALNIREAIISSMPACLNKAIVAGIGMFIAFIGLQNAGIIVAGSTLTELNPMWYTGAPAVALIGLAITGVLFCLKVRSALFLGILITAAVGIPFGVTDWAGGRFLPAAPYFLPFSFEEIRSDFIDFVLIVGTLVFTDLFEEVGTLAGCLGTTDLVKKDGRIVNCKKALYADAVGKTLCGMLGTSSLTTYVESAAGVSAGGRTGLTAVTVGVLFLASLFLGPLFLSVPSAAVTPALVLVGAMMASSFKDIDFTDFTESVPAFVCILATVVSCSISNGIGIGVVFFVLLKLFTNRRKEITPMVWAVFGLFVLKTVLGAI